MTDTDLSGSVVVVTGAARGIGRATAELFAELGARLVLNYHKSREAMQQVVSQCQQRGAQVETLQGDIGDPKTAVELCELALDRLGQVDVLVNNAAVAVESLLAMVSEEEIGEMVSTNILGLVYMSRAVLRPMLRKRSGCIINLSSTLASRPGRGNAVYAGTKGFVESFTRALAVEIGRKGVRVNAVAPGVIETDMTASVRALVGDDIVKRIGLGKMGSPRDVAEVIVFLASRQAKYIHGAVVGVDGAFGGGL